MIKINLKGSYLGIESYRKKGKGRTRKINRKSYKRKNLISRNAMLIVLLSVVVSILGVMNLGNKDIIKLSDESITYYINKTDKASKDKLQLSWKEIAAIALELNDGKENLDNEEEIRKIAEMFFEYDENKEVLGIKSFNNVLEEIGLNYREKSRANKYLFKIEDNYLNGELIRDKNKKKFILDIEGEAEKNYKEYGVLPSITIAQAILESGWGESTLSSEHKNLFGIKADERWDGKKVNMETKENYDDVINAYFRVYKSYEYSVQDHGRFLSENSRYRDNGIFDKKTYQGQAQSLEDAGYATVKNEEGELIYADLLTDIIRKNNLMIFDTKAQRKI